MTIKKIKTVWFLNSIIGTSILTPLIYKYYFDSSCPFVLESEDKILIALIILILSLMINLVFFLMDKIQVRRGWQNSFVKSNLLFFIFALIGQLIIGVGFTHFDFTHLLILISYFVPGLVLWNLYLRRSSNN